MENKEARALGRKRRSALDAAAIVVSEGHTLGEHGMAEGRLRVLLRELGEDKSATRQREDAADAEEASATHDAARANPHHDEVSHDQQQAPAPEPRWAFATCGKYAQRHLAEIRDQFKKTSARVRLVRRARHRRHARSEIIHSARVLDSANRSLAETGEARIRLAAALVELDEAS